MANKRYPTAFCKKCGGAIYNSEGTVDKKGFWTCQKCMDVRNQGARG